MGAAAGGRARGWVTRGAFGIVLATFFSDVGHEMATAVLPLYLGAIGLGPAALGAVEGLADLVYASAKLAGGLTGQRLHRKQPWVAAGYALTALGTASMSLVRGVVPLSVLRALSWAGRGFRSPLRDFLLADEIAATHFGRAFGLERAADMLGAVCGPLIAIALVASGLSARQVIAWSLLPALVPMLAIVLFVRDRGLAHASAASPGGGALPRPFLGFLGAVSLFGLSDFSRTFLILLAARALGDASASTAGTLSAAVGLYALHNGVSALAALAIGRVADRLPRRGLLTAGYALGAGTHVILALGSGSLARLGPAIVLSGVYVAAEETLEKAVCAELVPRSARSKAFGLLAAANSLGDLVSSVSVGLLLESGRSGLAFGACAVLAALGAAALWAGRGSGVESPAGGAENRPG
jgi:MFS family permease